MPPAFPAWTLAASHSDGRQRDAASPTPAAAGGATQTALPSDPDLHSLPVRRSLAARSASLAGIVGRRPAGRTLLPRISHLRQGHSSLAPVFISRAPAADGTTQADGFGLSSSVICHYNSTLLQSLAIIFEVSTFQIMASENERVSVAIMAEDAADRAKRLILALYQYENILGAEVVANAVADGARLGLIDDAVAGQLTTMSRNDADMYVSAAASGAVAAVLQAMANSLSETGIETNHGSLSAHRVKHDEINMVAATGIRRNNSLFSYFILAFSVVMAIVSVCVVVFRDV